MAGSATSLIFVATKDSSRQTCLLSLQKYACRDKSFATTKLCLLRQNYVCHNENLCREKKNVCCNKSFVVTSILLSRQKMCFVATKILLEAAPANDNISHKNWSVLCRQYKCKPPPHQITGKIPTSTHTKNKKIKWGRLSQSAKTRYCTSPWST